MIRTLHPLLLALILGGCGLSDHYTSIVPIPASLRYDAPRPRAADEPDVAKIAKAHGRLLFLHKPGRIEISAAVLDPDQRLRVCAKDPAAAWHPMMTATIVRDDFTDRRRAVASDGCEAQRFVAVDVD
jgi:hypothetical protein